MIAFLRGDFVFKSPAQVHVDVQGVGYEVQISLNTFSQIQHLDKGKLITYLHIREDSHILFGFFDVIEKELFLHLLSVSGIGAATARMMLSSVKPEELKLAIVQGNIKLLESIKGIGKKSAERVVLELRDKFGKSSNTTNISILTGNSYELDALNALVALGISRTQAEVAVKKVIASENEPQNIESIIKKALKIV